MVRLHLAKLLTNEVGKEAIDFMSLFICILKTTLLKAICPISLNLENKNKLKDICLSSLTISLKKCNKYDKYCSYLSRHNSLFLYLVHSHYVYINSNHLYLYGHQVKGV